MSKISKAVIKSHRWSLIAWMLLWVACTALIVPHNASVTNTHWGRFSFFDYRDTVYLPIRDFLSGGVPWDTGSYLGRHPGVQPYLLYVPGYWWITWPLAVISYRVSIALWLLVTTGSLVFITHQSLVRLIPAALARLPWLVLPVATVLAISRPARSALFQGQWALPCAAGAVYALLARNQEDRSVFASLIAFVKPPVGLPLLAIHVCIRRTWTATWTVLLSAAASVPIGGLVLYRLGGIRRAVAVLHASLTLGSGNDGSIPSYLDTRGVIANVWPRTPLAVQLLIVLGMAAILLTSLSIHWRHGGCTDVWYVTAACLVMVLVTPTMLYAYVVALPALVGQVVAALRAHGLEDVKATGLHGLVAFLLVIPFSQPEGPLAKMGFGPNAGNTVNGLALLLVAAITAAAAMRVRRHASPSASAPSPRRPLHESQ